MICTFCEQMKTPTVQQEVDATSPNRPTPNSEVLQVIDTNINQTPTGTTNMWPTPFVFPFDKLSTSVSDALHSQVNLLDSKQRYLRGLMVRAVCSKALQFKSHPSNGEKIDMARSIISAWPYLKEPIGRGFDGWLASIECHKTSRRELGLVNRNRSLAMRKRKLSITGLDSCESEANIDRSNIDSERPSAPGNDNYQQLKRYKRSKKASLHNAAVQSTAFATAASDSKNNTLSQGVQFSSLPFEEQQDSSFSNAPAYAGWSTVVSSAVTSTLSQPSRSDTHCMDTTLSNVNSNAIPALASPPHISSEVNASTSAFKFQSWSTINNEVVSSLHILNSTPTYVCESLDMPSSNSILLSVAYTEPGVHVGMPLSNENVCKTMDIQNFNQTVDNGEVAPGSYDYSEIEILKPKVMVTTCATVKSSCVPNTVVAISSATDGEIGIIRSTMDTTLTAPNIIHDITSTISNSIQQSVESSSLVRNIIAEMQAEWKFPENRRDKTKLLRMLDSTYDERRK